MSILKSQQRYRFQGSMSDHLLDEIIAGFKRYDIDLDLQKSSRIYLHHKKGLSTSVDISFDHHDPSYEHQQLLGYTLRTVDQTMSVRIKDSITEQGDHTNSFYCTVTEINSEERFERAKNAVLELYGGAHG